jgi:hypothetical protein
MMRERTHNRYMNMIRLYCSGEPKKAIASQYGMSPRALESAFDRMRRQYGARTMPHLITLLFREGVIE